MSKVYNYTKNGEIFSYDASIKEQEYLEKNYKITGITPGTFISECVKKYSNCSVKNALLNGFKDNLDFLIAIDKFGDLKLDLNYCNVKNNLSKATNKLERDEEEICKIIECD